MQDYPNPYSGLRAIAEDAVRRPASALYRLGAQIILAAILASVGALAIETVHPLYDEYQSIFRGLEYLLLAVFSLEYAANVWTSPDRRAYILSAWGLIDLASILPSLVEIAFGSSSGLVVMQNLRTLRVLRTLRILKLLKLASEQLEASAKLASGRRNTFVIDMQICAISLFTIMSISASLMYQAEGVGPIVPATTAEVLRDVEEAKEAGQAPPGWANDPMVRVYLERSEKGWTLPTYTMTSIPVGYWWSIVTLTTTGYGDFFPVTGFGHLVGGVTMIAGLALFALLTSVLGRVLMTSLFGKDGPADAVRMRHAVITVGARLPTGVTGHDFVARAFETAETSREASRPLLAVVADAEKNLGVLERSFLTAEIDMEAVAGSTKEVAHNFVMATTGGGSDRSGLNVTTSATWYDRAIRACFVDHSSRYYYPVHNMLTIMILISAFFVVVESVEWIHEEFHILFETIEALIVLAFTLEYIANYRMAPQKSRFVFGVWGLIDLFSIMPTYLLAITTLLHFSGLPINLSGGLLFKTLRTLKVLRVLRSLKLAKNAKTHLDHALEEKKSPFWTDMQVYFISLFIVLLTSATLVWNVEFDPANPEASMFVDVPVSLWWAMVTLTSVGYGDMYPQTEWGRIIGVGTMLSGLALFGVLTSVIGKALVGPLFGTSHPDDAYEVDVVPVPLDQPDGGILGLGHVNALLWDGLISMEEHQQLVGRLTNAAPVPS